jgi:hypothetical protein
MASEAPEVVGLAKNHPFRPVDIYARRMAEARTLRYDR